MQLLLRWAIAAGALYLTVWLLSLEPLRLAEMGAAPWYAWFSAAVIMGLVNALIRPLLILMTLPLNCLTFGLIGVLVNALMFWLVPVISAAAGLPVFSLRPLGALLGAFLMGLISGTLSMLLIRGDR